MTERQFQLIVMSFDGEFKTDFTGTLGQCRNQSADMGSKWYFYPFHFIVSDTPDRVVRDTGTGLVDMATKKPFLSKLFLNRKLMRVQLVFQNTYKMVKAENLELDCLEFEHYMIAHNRALLR